jgi:hypothetical protein
MIVDEVTSRARRWRELSAQIERLDDERNAIAYPLEDHAHALLTAGHRYERAHQRPRLHQIEDNGVWFKCSNGIDYHEDFDVTLTWEELAQDPADVARAYERKQTQDARKAARAQLANAQAAMRRAGLDP